MTNLIRVTLFSFILVLASCGGGGGSSSDGNSGAGTGTTTNDTTPNAFSFADETDVTLLTEIESNIVTITGINAPAAVSIINGEYSINGGAFTNLASTISNNQQIIVRQISSDQFASATDTTITIGGVSDIFSITTFVEDTNPTPFMLNDQSNAALNAIVESNSVIVAGINNSASVSITGGEYSIDGATYTNAIGAINNGQSIRVRHTTAITPATATNTFLNIGGVGDLFTSTTVNADTTPDDFSFPAQNDVMPNSVIVSDSITISGLNTGTLIQIFSNSQAEYSINNGGFTNTSRIVTSGQTVRVRLRASANFNTQTTANLSIGGVTRSFVITTAAPVSNTTPDPFSFFDQANVTLSNTRTSNFVQILGISAASPVSIIGGEYSINGGVFTSASGTIFNGQQIRVRQTSSANFSTTTDTILTVGGVSDTFSLTTLIEDITPFQFILADQLGVPTDTVISSNTIFVNGINSAAPISITGGEYSINGGVFTSSPSTVTNAQNVQVRQTSSSAITTTTNTILTIGGISDTFSVTTAGIDTIPDPFSFVDQTEVRVNFNTTSNVVNISGIDSPTDISIVNGEYSIDFGAFTSTSGSIGVNQSVQVRQTSSANFSTTNDTVLTIGGVSDTFSTTTQDLDTTPNPFSFTNQIEVPLDSILLSNITVISGFNSPTPISIVGGEYSINLGTFTSSPGTIDQNQFIRVRQTASSNLATTTSATVTIGGVSGSFNVTTITQTDTTPNAFSFFDQIDRIPNTLVSSTSVFISGINSPTPISVAGGEYSINGGAFTSSPGMISQNQNVRVRQTSSANFSTTTDTTLTIGGVVDTFSVTTQAQDTTPNTFIFSDRTNVDLNSLTVSGLIFISGINSPTPISIVGGEYSIDGGAFTAAAGTIDINQRFQVRQTSSSEFNTTTDTIVTVGGVSDTFSVTTTTEDSTPFNFFFGSQSNVPVNALITSGSTFINGINVPVPISVVGGEYSINGGAFTSSPGIVNSGENVTVRQTSSANFSTRTDTVLSVGGVSGTFSVTTESLDTSPNIFIFIDQTEIDIDTEVTSNSITVTGINSPTPISISSGEFSINGGAFTSAATTIDAGQIVVVRQTSSSTIETTSNTVLTIGGVSDTFSVTTVTADASPDAFSFTDQIDAEVSTLTTSNVVILAGINVAASISVSGGEFSIDGGPFSTSSSTINNGQSVVVRQTSSASTGTKTDTVLTIGGVSDTFSVTTLHPPGTTPDPFTFTDQIDVPRSDLRTSNTVTISGISVETTISITNGEYDIDGGGFTNLPSTILAGQQVTVRQTSANTFSTRTDATLTIGPSSDTFSVTTLATHAVVTNQELMITDLSVVESIHADPGGHWTFEHLITEMMPQVNPTAQEKSDFVLNWLSHWTSTQNVNGFNVSSRSSIQSQVINPWLTASGGTGVLDLSIAPFRLLAIVNRLDLTQRDSNGNVLNAGEGRFVFGVLNSVGSPLQFTVIFEYGLPATSEADLNQWMIDWHNLSLNNFSNVDPAYNNALLAVTDKFTSKDAAPLKPNGSALNQLRSNEIALSSPWELREFTLSSSSGDLEQVTVKENPDFSTINNSILLRDFINLNAQAIIDRTISIPDTFNGQSFLGGASLNFGGSSAIFRATGIINNEARHQLSLNTCSGCHGGETNTAFLHVFPRAQGQEANLSRFLKGNFNGTPLTVVDPVDFTTFRQFFDLDGRKNNLDCLLNACSAP